MITALLSSVGPLIALATLAATAGAVFWRLGRVERDVGELGRRFDASATDQGRRLGELDKRIAVIEASPRRRGTVGGGGGE